MLGKNTNGTAKSPVRKAPTPKLEKNVTVFAKTAHKSQIWINEMQKELKWMNGDSLYHLLRAVLQALRDQMNIHEAAHFAAQLPLLLRGTFYEGWNPHEEMIHGVTKDDFLQSVKTKLSPAGVPKFELEPGVLIALNVIKKHISAGEMNDLVGAVEPSLRAFMKKKSESSAAAL